MSQELQGTGFDAIHMALNQIVGNPDAQRIGFDDRFFYRLTRHRDRFGVLAGNTDGLE